MTKGKVVDLFCGAGGASLGFVKAGYEVVGAVDVDEIALETYGDNLCEGGLLDDYDGDVMFDEPLRADLGRGYEDPPTDDDDIPQVTFEDIRDQFDLEPGEVDVICGCPPCQNFSSLRDTEPWPEDEPKDNLLRAFVDFVDEEKPDVVFFENVRNIIRAGEENPTTYIDWLKRSMKQIRRDGDSQTSGGYGVDLDVLNTADYGVPQRRERTIALFVYGRNDDEFSLPEPTHAKHPKLSDLKQWKSVDEAFDEAEELKQDLEAGREQVDIEDYEDDEAHRARNHHQSTIDRMKAIRRHGDSWRDLQDTDDEEHIVDAHMDVDRGAHSAYGIMDGDLPAPTLTTRCTTPSCGRFTHPSKNRGLTPREAALLMTFPRWFELPSQNDAAERVVGNAVPPEFVEALVSRIPSHVRSVALGQ
ncbi:DNA cytosine methyltransferase [Halobacterium salinarum]|uniref:DNA cytosine methyltransferase n=1 Tax=Halobacterium salinarum TaxID=2242 RepID=UPI001F274044|nr:DNA cytosine methyltransferase [Halobacterium salinarum]MCF2206204.1 DNA cytosine methyltransferase [Halobacterium salinarum]MCF2240502.1 DNA cytosine methyltransferase [Halobacterium salinarum]